MSSDGCSIDKVKDFKYLGSYTNTKHDLNMLIAQAWGAMNSLQKVWISDVKKETKVKVFKGTVESILLYGSDSWSLTKALTKN